jgi:hypothetical protein
MEHPDWSQLPSELWAGIVQFLQDPDDWEGLKATTTWLRSLTLKHGFNQVIGLEIGAPSKLVFPTRCIITLQQRSGYETVRGYSLAKTIKFVKYIWKITPKLTKLAIKSLEYGLAFTRESQYYDGFVSITGKNRTGFGKLVRVILDCNRRQGKNIQSFNYSPIFTPIRYSPADTQMIGNLLELLISWRSGLISLTILDQGQYVEDIVNVLESDNQLQVLCIRTVQFWASPYNYWPWENPLRNRRDLQLEQIARLTSTPTSKIQHLSLFLNEYDNLGDRELVYIRLFLQSLPPKDTFRLEFPNLAYFMQILLTELGEQPAVSPWQQNLRVLDLGPQLRFFHYRMEFIDVFPNLQTCIGIPFDRETVSLANILEKIAVHQPSRILTLHFKCHPTWERHPSFERGLVCLNVNEFENVECIFTLRGPHPEILEITFRHERSTHQYLRFTVPIYTQQEFEANEPARLPYV